MSRHTRRKITFSKTMAPHGHFLDVVRGGGGGEGTSPLPTGNGLYTEALNTFYLHWHCPITHRRVGRIGEYDA